MSTGGKVSNQSRQDQSGGAQVVGGPPKSTLHQPPNFQGQSGQPDNQSTKRPSGKS